MAQNNEKLHLDELKNIKFNKSVLLLKFVDPTTSSPLKMDLLANPVFKAFLAGSFSGTCTTILLQPLDLVKTRIQSSKSEKRMGMFSVARQVLEMDRLPGLWRGMVPSIARTVPGVGLYFGSLHWLKTVTLGAGAQPSPVEAVALGIVDRSIAGGIMIPVTVIKTRSVAFTSLFKFCVEGYFPLFT